MRKGLSVLAILTVLLVPIEGCATSRTGKASQIGAILGGLAGAVVAVATGHKDNIVGYAAVGAAAGAGVGYAIGRAQDRRLANRDEAVRTANYQPSQGFHLGITSVEAIPAQVAPGNTSQIRVTWLAISPNPSDSIQVRAALTFKLANGDEAASSISNLQPLDNGGGIVETTIDLPIPARAPLGSYALDVQLSDSMNRVARTSTVPVFVG
ncbi:MAG: hypothetical protein IPJ17_12940 [Holophagales bacterium]|nr:MAG: hypothetical protein IPJ17_12940 [Holophagales bacterium]